MRDDIENDEDEPAVKLGELMTSLRRRLEGWLRDEHGDDNEVTSADTWSVPRLRRRRELWTICSHTEWLKT